MADQNQLSITETSPQYKGRLPQWRKIRDAREGEDQVKERGTDYLPRPLGMKKRDWDNYRQRASFYGVADRTLRGLTGLIMRVDPIVILPSRLDRMKLFASPEGFTLDQLIRESLRETLSLGRYGMLVDLPEGQSSDTTPYIATWRAEEIFRWEEEVDLVTGVRKLVRVVVLEEVATANRLNTTQLREMFLDPTTGQYTVQKWEQEEAETSGTSLLRGPGDKRVDYITGSFKRIGNPIVPTRFNAPLTAIPFIFVNTFDLRARTDKPPMLDLTDVNYAHFRNSADYETGLHMIGSPTPYVFGIPQDQKPTAIGPFQLWSSSSKDVRVGMLEYTGQGVATIRLAMQDKEDRMSVLGARLIRGEDRENVTAETVRLESREETSVLMGAVKTTELAFEAALRVAASWVGANPDEVDLTLNRDYVETRLAPAELTALVKSWQVGALSDEVYHRNLQRGEVMPADRDVKTERAAAEKDKEARTRKAAELAAELMPEPKPGSEEEPEDEPGDAEG